jgi:hypothetical protein
VTAALPFKIRPLPVIMILLALFGAAAVIVQAQLEGSDRGIPPIDSSSSYEIGGIAVDVVAKDSEQARQAGWRLAQRKGWQMLWSRMNGGATSGAPQLSDGTLGAIVAGIIVEQEQISSRRYIARLGVLFDRTRAGQLLGGHGQTLRSPPMLVIPIQITGATPTSFELRNPWQAAWARFRTGNSPVDYVRPAGNGTDPLLLNIGQSRRPGRGWWRMLLDQYGAADVLIPEVILHRAWPGGPVTAQFFARHGPDHKLLGSFTLSTANGDREGLAALLDKGVEQIDALYIGALRSGSLAADPSLEIEDEVPEEDETTLEDVVAEVVDETGVSSFTVQVDTPDAAALNLAESTIRGIPGVRSSNTTSLALGSLSVIRVSFAGDINLLRTALGARGWTVEAGADTLRIKRAPAPPSPAPAP